MTTSISESGQVSEAKQLFLDELTTLDDEATLAALKMIRSTKKLREKRPDQAPPSISNATSSMPSPLS